MNPGSLISEFYLIISTLCYNITGSEGIKRLNAQDQESHWPAVTMELGKKEIYPMLIRVAGICCSNKTPKISMP